MSTQTRWLLERVVIYGTEEQYSVFEGDHSDSIPYVQDTIPGCNGVRRSYPVAIYPSLEEAEAAARQRNLELHQELNPYWFTDLDYNLTSTTSEGNDHQRLLAEWQIEIPPPEPVSTPYGDYETSGNQARWFDEHSAEWPEPVREALWCHLVKGVGLYQVVEIEMETES